jgi:hypothetical protein
MLPAPVIEAIEGVVKAAEHHGWCRAGQGNTHLSFARLQESRRLLTQAIEAHASSMYEGGIEMGRAQGGGAL